MYLTNNVISSKGQRKKITLSKVTKTRSKFLCVSEVALKKNLSVRRIENPDLYNCNLSDFYYYYHMT